MPQEKYVEMNESENEIERRAAPRIELRSKSRLETFCDILRALGSGAETPAQIEYKTNIALPVLHSHIKTLESQGLVGAEGKDGRRVCRLSDKGYMFLSSFLTVRNELGKSQ